MFVQLKATEMKFWRFCLDLAVAFWVGNSLYKDKEPRIRQKGGKKKEEKNEAFQGVFTGFQQLPGRFPALLHQLSQGQGPRCPGGLREHLEPRKSHIHPEGRSTPAPCEDDEGGKVCSIKTHGVYIQNR